VTGLALLCSGLAGPAGCKGFGATGIDFLGRGGGWGLVARQADVENVLWNASGLGRCGAGGGSVFAGYMDYHVGLKGGALGYLGREGPSWSWGAFVSYISSGDVALTSWDDPTGGLGTSYSYGGLTGGVSCGLRFVPALSVGVGIKAAREGVDGASESAVLGDLSATLALLGSGGVGPEAYASVVGRDLVLSASREVRDQEPGGMETGLALKLPAGETWIGCSMMFERAGRRDARLGVAALLSTEFEARLGYKRRVGEGADASYGLPWHRGLTAGFGVAFGKLWVDYTYENADPLDGVHRIGLRTFATP